MSLVGPLVLLGLILLAVAFLLVALFLVARLNRPRAPADRLLPPREARVVSHTSAFNRADPLQVVSASPTAPPHARDRRPPNGAARFTESDQALYDFLRSTIDESLRILPRVPLADLARRTAQTAGDLAEWANGEYLQMLIVEPRSGRMLLAVEVEEAPNRWEREAAELHKQELLKRLRLPVVRLRRGGYWGRAEQEQIRRALGLSR